MPLFLVEGEEDAQRNPTEQTGEAQGEAAKEESWCFRLTDSDNCRNIFQLQKPVGKKAASCDQATWTKNRFKMDESRYQNLHNAVQKEGMKVVTVDRTFSTVVSNGWDLVTDQETLLRDGSHNKCPHWNTKYKWCRSCSKNSIQLNRSLNWIVSQWLQWSSEIVWLEDSPI